MTREEAIKELIRAFEVLDFSCHMDNHRKEAFNMAKVALEQEPCDDAVSRQAVLDMLEDINAETEGVGFYYEHYVDYIKSLPSVNPQDPKTGHWIEHRSRATGHIESICSECGAEEGYPYNDYCGNCGARMVEPQESEEQE